MINSNINVKWQFGSVCRQTHRNARTAQLSGNVALFSHEGGREVLIELLSIARLSICHFGRNICAAKVIAIIVILLFGTALFNT